MVEICGINPTDQFAICGIHHPGEMGGEDSTYYAACIRPAHWSETHLLKTPDGRYFAWRPDHECECCEADDPNRCFVHTEVSENEAARLMTYIDLELE